MSDQDKLENERDRIENSDDLTADERRLLDAFDRKLTLQQGRRVTKKSHLNALQGARVVAEATDVVADLIIDDSLTGEALTAAQQNAKRAAETAITFITREYTNGYTRDSLICSLRVFIDLVGDQDLIPEFNELFKCGYSPDDTTPAPGTILKWGEDIVPLIEAEQGSIRNQALIATQGATGCRPKSETHKLRYKHVEDRGDHFVITTPTDSKTGERDVRMFAGAPYLRKYLRNHPARTDDGIDAEAPVWMTEDGTKHLSYAQFGRVFRKASGKAGITKPTNPRHFRASRASVLASRQYINQVDLENHFGWIRGSNAASHYISRFGGETGRHVALADGHEMADEEPDPISPVQCPNCDEWTPRHRDRCLWCSTEIDPTETGETQRAGVTLSDQTEQVRDDLVSRITNGEWSEEQLETARNLAEAVREYPQLLDQMDALRDTLDDMIEDDDNDDDASGASAIISDL